MIHVVLGCHKSGTTLVAEILHRSGIPMLEGTVEETHYDQGDFFERPDLVHINQDILGHGDPAEDHPAPPVLCSTEAQRRAICEKIDACEAAHADWGFKDPRLCLTYPVWRELLPEHLVIGVYRGLPEVWAHQAKQGRRHRSLWKAIRMWSDYNWRLADILERRQQTGRPYLLLRFESLMTDDREFARLQAFLGRSLVDPRKPDRYRSRERSRIRIALVDAVLGTLGHPRPSSTAARLERLRTGG